MAERLGKETDQDLRITVQDREASVDFICSISQPKNSFFKILCILGRDLVTL